MTQEKLYSNGFTPFSYFQQYEKLIQSVTAKDVRDVANKYFNGNYVESIVDKAK